MTLNVYVDGNFKHERSLMGVMIDHANIQELVGVSICHILQMLNTWKQELS